ncbi:hypothetical protein D0S45_19375 [Marinifilum sp. JC120]|nr:hypothetical protein D0S45_19375 [Marinifilum sp. JC120]
MSIQILQTPFLGTNDTEAQLVSWEIVSGDQISPNTVVCVLESTKAAIEIEAEFGGYIFPVVAEGEFVESGEVLAVISEVSDFDFEGWRNNQDDHEDKAPIPTRKAQLLMQRHGIDPSDIAVPAGERIREADVHSVLKKHQLGTDRRGLTAPKRLAILGGVSGGGALIVIDAVRRMENMLPVVIYDRDAQYHGRSVLGVPVLGSFEDRKEKDRADGIFDVLVIAFNRNLQERDKVFQQLSAEGYAFANVIAPDVEVRSMVKLGTGNVILSRAYVGACSQIGSNNFVSANVCLEHGNVLGDSCAFGPGVYTSGNVTIGSRVRFGAGIYVEPELEIGDDAVIGSGQTLVTGVSGGKVLTTRTKG